MPQLARLRHSLNLPKLSTTALAYCHLVVPRVTAVPKLFRSQANGVG